MAVDQRRITMRNTSKNPLFVAAVALALVLASCGDADDDAVTGAAQEADDAIEQAETELESADTSAVAAELRAQGLTTLATAVETVGLENLIQGQEFTLFAPQDDAWLSLSTDELGNLLADPERAGELLESHVVNQRITSDELAGMDSVQSASGRSLTVGGTPTDITVDGASVVEADITAGDGIIHIVDAILASELIAQGAQTG
jgi:uncharacterized surface protein with fasciclin (FAS1) repeats